MEAFEGYYDTFIETQDMSGLIEEYNANLVNLGNEVCVLDPAGETAVSLRESTRKARF